jgi:hypothetical protein
MSLSSTLRRTVSLVALTAVAGSAALAGSASAASVEKAAVITPGATIPVDFPGYREPANKKLKANYRIVVVKAEVGRNEKLTTIVSAPKGFVLVTFAIDNGGQIGPRADSDYVGKRSARLTLSANRSLVAAGQVGHGTIYALARRA